MFIATPASTSPAWLAMSVCRLSAETLASTSPVRQETSIAIPASTNRVRRAMSAPLALAVIPGSINLAQRATGSAFTDSRFIAGICLIAGAVGTAKTWASGYLNSFQAWLYAKNAFDKWSLLVAQRFTELRGVTPPVK
jgi:hypothetical protein